MEGDVDTVPATGIVVLPPDVSGVSMEPTRAFAPETLVSAAPEELIRVLHEGRAGLTAGVWSASPVVARFEAYPFDEFMTVLDGSLTLEPDGADPITLHRGQSFVIPKGWRGVWRQTETLRKHFVVASA